MTAERSRVVVARLRRPWGRRGELLIDLHTDWPEERLASGRVLRIEGADGGITEHQVRGCRRTPAGWSLALAGVDDIGAAEALAGGWAVLGPDDAPAGDGPRHADVIGLEVVTVTGEHVGRVVGVEERPHGDLLHVAGDDGRESLVPTAPSICVAFELAAGRVVVDPPRGLLDLDQADEAGAPRARRSVRWSS